MADTTNENAIEFSNSYIRTNGRHADQAYVFAAGVSQAWTAQGSNQEALDSLRGSIQVGARHIRDAYRLAMWTRRLWDGGMSGEFTNSPTDKVQDGSENQQRPFMDTADVHWMITTASRMMAWMSDNGDFGGNHSGNLFGHLNTILAVTEITVGEIDLTMAGNVINRMNEYEADMIAANFKYRNKVLRVVNPREYGVPE